MNKLYAFVYLYNLYRKHHPMKYALRRAWGIAYNNEDF